MATRPNHNLIQVVAGVTCPLPTPNPFAHPTLRACVRPHIKREEGHWVIPGHHPFRVIAPRQAVNPSGLHPLARDMQHVQDEAAHPLGLVQLEDNITQLPACRDGLFSWTILFSDSLHYN